MLRYCIAQRNVMRTSCPRRVLHFADDLGAPMRRLLRETWVMRETPRVSMVVEADGLPATASRTTINRQRRQAGHDDAYRRPLDGSENAVSSSTASRPGKTYAGKRVDKPPQRWASSR